MSLFKAYLNRFFYFIYDLLLFVSPSLHNAIFFRKTNSLNFQNFKQKSKDTGPVLLDIFLDEDYTFIDVGANIGEFVNRAQKHIPGNNIWAFEPIPKLYKRLKKIFPQANISQIALSDKKDKSAFKIPIIKQQQILTRATLNTTFEEVEETNKQVIQVITDTLDHQIQLLNIDKVSLLKIDVEGHEWKVLDGAKSTLEKHRPVIIVEIEQRHHSFPIQLIINDICSLNYNCYYLNLSELKLLPVENHELLQKPEHFGTSKYINNFIFISKYKSIAKINDRLSV